MNRQGLLHHLRRNRPDEQLSDGRIEVPPGDLFTGSYDVGNPGPLAPVIGDEPLPAQPMVAHRHTLPAARADH